MKNILTLLSLTFLIFSCSIAQTSIKNTQAYNSPQNEFIIDETILGLLENSLNSKELEQYFHFELKERLPLKVLYKELLNDDDLVINCFGNLTKIIKSVDNQKGSIIELIKGFKSDKEVTFIFKYPIEGITITSRYRNNNQNWINEDVKIIEN